MRVAVNQPAATVDAAEPSEEFVSPIGEHTAILRSQFQAIAATFYLGLSQNLPRILR
jgi:hypothetical protein